MDLDLGFLDRPKQPEDLGLDLSFKGLRPADRAIADLGANPDEAAKAARIAPEIGLSGPAAEVRLPEAEREWKAQGVAAIIDGNTHLQRYVEGNPMASRVSNDDYKNLDDFSKALQGLVPGQNDDIPVGNFDHPVDEFKKGFEATEYGRKSYLYSLGGAGFEKDLIEYERKQALNAKPEVGILEDPVGHFASFLGGLSSNMLVGGTAGATVGAVPGGIVGGPVGALGGAVAGFGGGVLTDFVATTAGQTYRHLDLVRDAHGEPLSEGMKQFGALTTGVFTGAVAMAAGPMAAKGFAGLVLPMFAKKLGEPVTQALAESAVVNLAKAGIGGGFLNLGLQLGPVVIQDTLKEFSGQPFPTIWNDPVSRKQFGEQAISSFTNGLVLFGALGTLPIGANYMMDRARINQTIMDGAARNQAHAAAVNSLTRERSPEMFKEFAQFATEDTRIPAERIAALREKDPTAFDYVPDIDAKVAEAAERGGDVVIPTPDYYAHTKEEHHAAIAEDIRSGTGLTIREAKELEKHWVAYHGTAASFDKFDSKWRLTGEGANVYGAGHYVAERHGIAKSYYEQLAEKEYFVGGERLDETNPAHVAAQYLDKHLDNAKDAVDDLKRDIDIQSRIGDPEAGPNVWTQAMQAAVAHIEEGKPVAPMSEKLSGNLYQVRVKADPKKMLHWDKTIEEQTPEVQAALKNLNLDSFSGEEAYADLKARKFGEGLAKADKTNFGPEMNEQLQREAATNATAEFRDAGLHGIQYYDASSRTFSTVTDLEASISGIKRDIEQHTKYVADENLSPEMRKAAEERIPHFEEELKMMEDDLARAKLAEKDRTHNLVIFHDDHLEITHVNGEPIPRPEVLAIAEPLLDATAKARKALWLDPLIIPDAAGLNKADFARYSKHIQETQRAITKAVFDTAEREIRRRDTKLWKDDAAKMAEDVAREWDQRPDLKAENLLRGKYLEDVKGKLDKDEINELFSADEQKAMGGTPSDLLRKDLVGGKDSVESLAELTGHDSAKALVTDLIALERDRRERNETPAKQYERMLREEVAARMEATHGKLNENIMREAVEAAMEVKQLDVFADEAKQIIAEGNIDARPVSKEDMLRSVADRISGMPHKEAINVKGFERAMAQAGARVQAALLKGDYVDAFQQKQIQTYNFMLAREARAAAKDAGAVGRLSDQLQRNLSIDSWHQDFVDAGHSLLTEIGEAVPRSNENLSQAMATAVEPPRAPNFNGFVEQSNLRDGYAIIPLPDNFPTDASKLTMAEVRSLRQSLESLAFAGREAKKVLVGEKMEEFNAVKDALLTNLDSMKTKIELDGDPKLLDGVKAAGRMIDAQLMRMEQLAAWFDKNDPMGPFTQAVIRPLKAAQHEKDGLLQMLAGDFKDLPGDRAWRKSLTKKIENTVLLDAKGNPMRMTGERLMAIILNMGNEVNLRKLTEGMGWDEGTLRAWVDSNATKQHFDFAQGVWDMMEKLWPHVAEASKRNTGVAVERIAAQRLDTDFGSYKGGYYPLFRDRESAPVTLKDDLMDSQFVSPFVNQASAMKSRTGATYRMELSLDQLPSNLRELVHNITHTEAVRNAHKILSDADVRESIAEKFGPEYRDLLMPWLKNIAQDGGKADNRQQAWFNSWSSAARQNAIYMLIGWRPSTAAIHGGAALANSVYEVGPWQLSKAFANLAAKPESILSETDAMFRNPDNLATVWEWAVAQSGELRNRNHNIDRDVGRAMDKALFDPKISGWRKANMMHATSMVSGLDKLSAVPTFVAEYKAQRLEGVPHEDAVYIADRAVRQAHGSSGLMDLPSIQRMNEGTKWFTSFYGYFSHNYNRQRDTGRNIAAIPGLFSEGKYLEAFGETGRAFYQSMMYLLAPAMIHQWVRPHAGDEDTGYGTWAAKAMGMQLASDVPVLRDVAQAWTSGRPAQVGGVLGELMSGIIVEPVKEIHRYAKGDEMSAKAGQHFLEMPGWVVGFPFTRYSAGQWQYIWDVTQGNEPDNDYWRLLMDGNPNHRKH